MTLRQVSHVIQTCTLVIPLVKGIACQVKKTLKFLEQLRLARQKLGASNA